MMKGILGRAYAVLCVLTVFDGTELAFIEGYPVTGAPVAIMIPTEFTAMIL